jgi:ribosomal protein S14
MRHINIDDKLRRDFISSSEISRRLLLYLRRVYGGNLITHLLEKLSKEGCNISKVQTPCLVTGRSRGVLRRYRLSRIETRRLFAKGILPGVRKSSW